MIDDFISSFMGGTVTVMAKVVAGAERLFGDDPPKESPADWTNNVLFGAGGPKTAPPPPPPPPGGPGGAGGGSEPGSGGLHDGAGQAGQSYGDNVNAASLTDEKLSELLKQIFTNNQNARDQVNAILADIQAKTKQVGPELGDPASLLSFHQYLDQKFGEIQKLLSDSQVDAKTQSAIMDALGQEYKTNSPKKGGDGSAGDGGSGGGDGGSGGGDGGSGGGDGGSSGGGGGADPLTDPMAGMGPLGGMDPMASMMGPAMAGLGSLPGALGGLGGGMGGSPLDALGPALGSLGPALAGAKDSFGDKSGADGRNGNDFTDTKGDKPDKPEDFKDENGGAQGKSPAAQGNTPATPPAEQAGPQPAPGTPVGAAPAGAPAAAPGDPQKTVDMPGGTPVTAPSAERAAAMRSVIGGSSVTGAYEGQDVHLPPPGTPVLAPVSRNDLQPGDYGQFSTKAPIMYMGNNKIWMDGQLQPISALQSSSDFLGWSAPPANGGQQQAGAAPPTTPPSGKV
jgi:hypothetical protein